MKKIITICIVSAFLLPNFSYAQTVSNTELLAQIQNLMNQVLVLLQKIQEMEHVQDTQRVGSVQQPVQSTATSTPTSSIIFENELDQKAREYMANFGSENGPKIACLGEYIPNPRGTTDTRVQAKEHRDTDPVFNRSCELWGY